MRKIYSFNLCAELIISGFWSCWAAALLEKGFPIGDLAYSLAALFLSQCLFEVPTGLFADRIGRKRCTIVGLLVAASGFVIVAFAQKMTDLIPGFFVAGLGLTFMSGARMAWLYELACVKIPEMRTSPQKQDEFFLNMNVMGRFAVIASAFGAIGLLEAFGSGMWLSIAAVSVFTAWYARQIGEDPFKRSSEPTHFREIRAQLLSPALLLTIMAIFFFGAEVGVRNLVNQPYVLQITGGSKGYLAFFQAILAVARLGGIFFYRWLSRRRETTVSRYFALAVPLLMFSFAQALATQVRSFWVFIAFYCAAIFAMGWYFPIRDAFINSLVPANMRATLLSFDSMLMNLGSAIALVAVAKHVHGDSVASLWWIGAGALVASSIWLSIAVWIRNASLSKAEVP